VLVWTELGDVWTMNFAVFCNCVELGDVWTMNYELWTLLVWTEFWACMNYGLFYLYFDELCMNFRFIWIVCMYLCLDKFIFIIIEIILWNELDELNFTSWTNSSRLTSCKRANELARFLTRRSRIHPSSSGPFVETSWLVSLTKRDEFEIESARLEIVSWAPLRFTLKAHVRIQLKEILCIFRTEIQDRLWSIIIKYTCYCYMYELKCINWASPMVFLIQFLIWCVTI
jgi:hypothetical protein